jgi:HEAT repeat protein
MTTMAFRGLAVSIALAALTAAIRADEPQGGAPEKDMKRLIGQLGSERYKDREQATRHLAQLGKAALPGLKEAAKSPDAEVRRRAQRLLEQLEPPAARSGDARREPLLPAVKSYL